MLGTTTPTVTELVADHVGILAVVDGMAYYLTACCRASVTGVSAGAACRACYRPVADELGMAWMVADEAAWARWEAGWLASLSPDAAQQELGRKVAALVREKAAA